MIKLENVTTNKLIYGTEVKTSLAIDLKMFLRRNGIEDYQALKDFLESGKKVVGREFLEAKLQEVEEKIQRDNDLGFEPQIYVTNGYQNVDEKSIKKTEGKNKGSVLIFKSPLVCHAGKKAKITNLTIHDIKHLLSHVTPVRGINALTGTLSGYGDFAGETLLSSLNFFEEQISRQAAETQDQDRNLFIVDGTEKKAIVEENIDDVLNFFVDNAKTCVWGELTSAQKRILTEIVMGRRSEKHRTIRQNMIDVVSNYTTLSEIRDGVKEKTLERFVIR